MHQYHQTLPLPVNMSNSPVDPVPYPGRQPPPMRYKVERSAHETNSSLQEFTVEVEYWKYALGKINSSKTDILKFWEVSEVHVTGRDNNSHPHRPIKPSSRHSLQLPWII